MVYKGKIGFGYFLIVIFYNVLPITDHFIELDLLNIIFLSIYYLGNLLMLPPMITNKVVIDKRQFILYFGFQKTIFNIDDILDIHKSHNPVASSALSLDRVYVNLKHQEVYISLKDNNGFINEIKKIRPSLNKE